MSKRRFDMAECSCFASNSFATFWPAARCGSYIRCRTSRGWDFHGHFQIDGLWKQFWTGARLRHSQNERQDRVGFSSWAWQFILDTNKVDIIGYSWKGLRDHFLEVRGEDFEIWMWFFIPKLSELVSQGQSSTMQFHLQDTEQTME